MTNVKDDSESDWSNDAEDDFEMVVMSERRMGKTYLLLFSDGRSEN